MKAKTTAKILVGLSALTMAFSLASCGGNVEKTTLTYGRLYDEKLGLSEDHFDLIAHSGLTSKVESKDSFLLLVYKKNDTCGCWINEFKPNILKYMKKTNVRLYAIPYTEFDGGKDAFGLTVSSSNQTMAVFKDGALKYQKTRNGDDDPWAIDYPTFEKWMDERIEQKNALYVSKEQVQELYEGETYFTLGFLRETCGDCSYIARNELKTWLDSSSLKSSLYLLDCDQEGIRLHNGEAPGDKNPDQIAAASQWKAFKDFFGLSEVYDHEYGYGGGYVPYFAYIAPGNDKAPYSCVMDASVTFNDTLVEEGDHFVVQESYYSAGRLANLAYLENSKVEAKVLEGLKVNKDDVTLYEGGYVAWNHKAAATYHWPLLKEFLQYYIQ